MWECIYLFRLVFSFTFNTYQEEELLDHMVILFLIFQVTAILLPKPAAPFYIPINHASGFQLFHILTNIFYFLLLSSHLFFVVVAIRIDVKQQLIFKPEILTWNLVFESVVCKWHTWEWLHKHIRNIWIPESNIWKLGLSNILTSSSDDSCEDLRPITHCIWWRWCESSWK